MFAISFRIPIDVLGTRQYINGSTLYHERLKPGTIISVVDKSWVSSYNGIDAEVIQSNGSQRSHDSFKWGII